MFISRVEINPHNRKAMKALASPQMIHAAVESSSPTKIDDNFQRNLWRLDKLGNSLFLLVVSEDKPDFQHIIDQFGWPASDQKWETKTYDSFLSNITNGQQWQFRLCANPVHSFKSKTDEAKRGKIYAHITNERRKKWLLDRAEKLGFYLKEEEFDIMEQDEKKFRRENKMVTISQVIFEGILIVKDSMLFRQSMTNGVGRAKAYGCGLLTVMRVRV
jgi:CRISPR system Cascade subunit CasE